MHLHHQVLLRHCAMMLLRRNTMTLVPCRSHNTVTWTTVGQMSHRFRHMRIFRGFLILSNYFAGQLFFSMDEAQFVVRGCTAVPAEPGVRVAVPKIHEPPPRCAARASWPQSPVYGLGPPCSRESANERKFPRYEGERPLLPLAFTGPSSFASLITDHHIHVFPSFTPLGSPCQSVRYFISCLCYPSGSAVLAHMRYTKYP